jgi:hypothetical protein
MYIGQNDGLAIESRPQARRFIPPDCGSVCGKDCDRGFANVAGQSGDSFPLIRFGLSQLRAADSWAVYRQA